MEMLAWKFILFSEFTSLQAHDCPYKFRGVEREKTAGKTILFGICKMICKSVLCAFLSDTTALSPLFSRTCFFRLF